jgi:trehalose-phosphatase
VTTPTHAADAADPHLLAGILPPVSSLLLAVDFDGTLAPIVNDPATATLLPDAAQALQALAKRTVVAIVSGRRLSELVSRFEAIEGLYLIGEHGRVWQQPDGSVTIPCDTGQQAAAIDMLVADLHALLDGTPGWSVEPKPAGVAVHHRNASDADVALLRPQVLALLHAASTPLAPFRVIHGHAVDELLPQGVSKGAALDALCALFPACHPVAIGDDVTDEDAFSIARAKGGTGILVAAKPRPSGASYRLSEPVDVATFLTLLAARSS